MKTPKMNNPKLTANARNLRQRMTPEELHLWLDFLKLLPVVVKRQKPIGRYIVDFYIPSVKLVIELDGSQHGREENHEADRERDAFLQSMGITVLRYTNIDIHTKFEGVCKDICNHIPNLSL